MSEALGSGWLIALFVGLVPTVLTVVVVPFTRWVAGKWRMRVELEKAAREKDRKATEEIKDRLHRANDKITELTWKYNECEMRRMLAEERAGWYEERLDRAESGHGKGGSDERP